jgi:ABC-type multidrug transport system fused ATPase/permease subunit
MKKTRYQFLRSQLKPFSLSFVGITVILFVQMFLTVLAPLPVKYILNKVIEAKPETIHKVVLNDWYIGSYDGSTSLLLLTVIGLVLGAVLTFAFLAENLWTGRTSFQVAENIRRDFFARIFTRRQAYLDSKKKVDLLGRVSGDVSNLEALLTTGLAAVVRDTPMIFILLGIMFLVDFKLTLMFSFCLPVFYFIGHYFTKKMRAAFKVLRRRTITFEEESYEAMSSMAIVKSLRGEEKIQEKLFSRSSEINQLSRNSLNASMGLETSMEMTQHVVKTAFIFFGCWAIFRNEIKLGDLFQLMAYMGTLSKHVNNVNKFLSKYPKIHASIERLEELNVELNQHPEESGVVSLIPAMAKGAPQAISFQEVSVSYDNERSILNSFTFDLPKSQLVAVVGPSGVGKSTFSRLLNRLLDPVGGCLKIAGLDLRQYDVKSLRSLVRTISQETFLISGTVRENLLLASKRAIADDEIMKALACVNADGFISKLPLGLDTLIGEGGLQLSGGEAQRVHLARAFLDMESEILLFDEPTTGLDTTSAQKVIESITELARQKTLVLWVTHRMQEVHSANKVLFFRRDGNPIFAGHEELLLNSSAYRELMAEAGKPDNVTALKPRAKDAAALTPEPALV